MYRRPSSVQTSQLSGSEYNTSGPSTDSSSTERSTSSSNLSCVSDSSTDHDDVQNRRQEQAHRLPWRRTSGSKSPREERSATEGVGRGQSITATSEPRGHCEENTYQRQGGVATREMVSKGSSGSGSSSRGQLCGLIYCKFDAHQGPIVVCSAPPGILADSGLKFRSISKYFFLHEDLNSQIISLRVGAYRVLGVPIKLENPKVYERNCFQFTLCLVVDTLADVTPFRAMAVQFGYIFRELEMKSFLLSSSDGESKLQGYLSEILNQLAVGDTVRVALPDSQDICLTVGGPPSYHHTVSRPSFNFSSILHPHPPDAVTPSFPPPQAPPKRFHPRSSRPVNIDSADVPLPLVSLLDAVNMTALKLSVAADIAAKLRAELDRHREGEAVGIRERRELGEREEGRVGRRARGARWNREVYRKSERKSRRGSQVCDGVVTTSGPTYPVFFDATLLQVIGFVDGIRTVRNISICSQVDETLVTMCLEHLFCHGLILFIDIFHLSNRYRLTPKFGTVWKKRHACRHAPMYVVGGDSVARALKAQHVPPVPLEVVLYLYSHLRDYNFLGPTANLRDYTKVYFPMLDLYKISMRHFIAFGHRYKFLRRVHEYPVLVPHNNSTLLPSCSPLPHPYLCPPNLPCPPPSVSVANLRGPPLCVSVTSSTTPTCVCSTSSPYTPVITGLSSSDTAPMQLSGVSSMHASLDIDTSPSMVTSQPTSTDSTHISCLPTIHVVQVNNTTSVVTPATAQQTVQTASSHSTIEAVRAGDWDTLSQHDGDDNDSEEEQQIESYSKEERERIRNIIIRCSTGETTLDSFITQTGLGRRGLIQHLMRTAGEIGMTITWIYK
eukprot:GHVQ01010022.1.p1 GENE.GHVQ01010022.1~~GHVQ01010022.1.p1  ORF type:complete len:839 (-),score=91.20 GHVQ01010022.1:1096-3612(-)